MTPEEAARDYPARAWHSGAGLYLCLPCCDLFGHLLPGGNAALEMLLKASNEVPCALHLDPSKAPCSFTMAVEIPNPDDAETVLENNADVYSPGSTGGLVAPPGASMDTPATPRWTVVVTPTENMEGSVQLSASADNVTYGEMAHVLSKVITMLTRQPLLRVPTDVEVAAQAAADKLTKEHPAKRLYVKAGEQLWLSEAAVEALPLNGWIDAGPVPEGVSRVCDFAKDPARVNALVGGVVPATPTPLALVEKE